MQIIVVSRDTSILKLLDNQRMSGLHIFKVESSKSQHDSSFVLDTQQLELLCKQ